jgi:type IX secretion system substrate protein/beta-propeller repeat-containing protein
MKKIFLLFIAVCISFIEMTNAQSWIWSRQIGGLNTDATSTKTCVDQNGNLYVIGYFQSNPCYLDNDTLQSLNGYSDCFIAKYDASGNELWVKSFGGFNSMMQPEGMSNVIFNNQTNSIFINGTFYGMCIFDSDTLISAGQSDAFLARLDLNGNVIWIKKAGGTSKDYSSAMDVDLNGNAYASFFLALGGAIDTITSLQSGVYMSKFDSNGNILWAVKKFNANMTPEGYDAQFLRIKIIDNRIFGIGLCTVDSFTVDTVTVHTNFSTGQNIIGCLDTNNATTIWIKPCASSHPQLMSIAADNDKNCFITGNFSSSAIFGNDTLQTSNVSELFLAKYDSTGKNIWNLKAVSSIGAYAFCIEMDYDGGLYLTGGISGTVSFGSFTVNSAATNDMFIARYDTGGNCIGVRHLGEASGSAIIVDSNNKIYATGVFYNTVNFDSNPSLTSHGQEDIYVAKSDAITGIGGEDRIVSNQLLIYANPTKGTCNVTIPDEFKHDKNLTLQIFDNTGRLLQQTKVEMQQEKVKVNLEEEAKGVYNVTLSNGKKSYNGKIVFE